MDDIRVRARDILNGDGPIGFYDDYDQACAWAGLVAELLALVEEQDHRIAGMQRLLRNPQTVVRLNSDDEPVEVEL